MVSSTFKKIKIITSVSVTALLLGACGGGGGGVVTAVAPKVGITTSTSSKISLLSSPLSSLNQVDATAAGKGVFMEVTQSRTGGADVALSRSTQSLTFNLEENNSNIDSDDRMEIVNSDGSSTGALSLNSSGAISNNETIIVGGSADMGNASFGLIMVNKGNNTAAIGGFHVGAGTASMPTSASATYTGKTVGTAIASNGAAIVFGGDTNVNANFGAGTVTGRNSNLTIVGGDFSGQGTGFDVTMNGSISGNSYSGSSALVNPGTNTNIGIAGPSNLSGGFYGAGAADTAGAYSASSSGTSTGNTISVVGAFGATK